MPERAFATETWTEDDWFQGLNREQRYLFIYLWTNSHCKQSGLYSIPLPTMAFETRILDEVELVRLMTSLSPKVEWYAERNIVWVKNFLRHQAKSPKFIVAALKNLNNNIPEDLRAEFELYNQELIGDTRQQMSLTRRESVLIRDNFHCQYCDKEIIDNSEFEIDHIIPTSRGGKDNYLNLVASCRECNQTKFDRLPSEAGLETPKPSTFHASQALYLLRTDEKLRTKWLTVFPKRESVQHLILFNIDQHHSRLTAVDAGYSSVPVPVPYTDTGNNIDSIILVRIVANYQQEIGVVSPVIGTELKDFTQHCEEKKVPVEWIDDAFKEAAANNKRSWSYVKAILTNWIDHGKGSGKKGKASSRELPKVYTESPDYDD